MDTNRLTFRTKLLYGAGDTGFSLLYTSLDVYLLYFLITIVKLPPAYAAAAIFFGRTWDWINDPLVGWLTDRTRSRWGRRRPYLLFGPIPFGVSFVLLWWIPPISSHVGLAVYYGAAYFIFDLLATLVSVPYVALTPELTPDYDERTSLNMYRMSFSILAGILGFATPELANLGVFPDQQTGYLIVALLFGLISAFPLWGVFIVAREKPIRSPKRHGSVSDEGGLLSAAVGWLRGRWKTALSLAAYLILWTTIFYILPRLQGEVEGGSSWNDFIFYTGFFLPMCLVTWRAFRHNLPFLISIGIHLLTWATISLIQAMLPFFITYGLDMESRMTEIMLVVFVSALIWLPIWNRFSQRFGKQLAYIAGMLSLVAVLLVMATLPRGTSFDLIIGLALLAGIGVSVAHIIPHSIIPDTLEWAELKTGERREGMYYSMAALMRKVASSVAIPWAALILALSGFNEALKIDQPPSALTAIRLLVGVGPGLIMLLGVGLAAIYPLNRARHARIRQLLERRQELRIRT